MIHTVDQNMLLHYFFLKNYSKIKNFLLIHYINIKEIKIIIFITKGLFRIRNLLLLLIIRIMKLMIIALFILEAIILRLLRGENMKKIIVSIILLIRN